MLALLEHSTCVELKFARLSNFLLLRAFCMNCSWLPLADFRSIEASRVPIGNK